MFHHALTAQAYPWRRILQCAALTAIGCLTFWAWPSATVAASPQASENTLDESAARRADFLALKIAAKIERGRGDVDDVVLEARSTLRIGGMPIDRLAVLEAMARGEAGLTGLGHLRARRDRYVLARANGVPDSTALAEFER